MPTLISVESRLVVLSGYRELHAKLKGFRQSALYGLHLRLVAPVPCFFADHISCGERWHHGCIDQDPKCSIIPVRIYSSVQANEPSPGAII